MIGDQRIAPVAAAVRQLVAEMRSAGEAPADEVVSVVVSCRPDGHGRVAAVAVDLLASSEDEWEGDALISEPWA